MIWNTIDRAMRTDLYDSAGSWNVPATVWRFHSEASVDKIFNPKEPLKSCVIRFQSVRTSATSTSAKERFQVRWRQTNEVPRLLAAETE